MWWTGHACSRPEDQWNQNISCPEFIACIYSDSSIILSMDADHVDNTDRFFAIERVDRRKKNRQDQNRELREPYCKISCSKAFFD